MLKRVWFWLLIIFVGLPITIRVISGITSSDEQPGEMVEKLKEALIAVSVEAEGSGALAEGSVEQKDAGEAEPSLAHMLAVIDWGIPPSEKVLARYETLIGTAAELFKEDEQQIADVAVKACQMLAEKGINEQVVQVLQAFMASIPEDGEELKPSVVEIAAMYVPLRTKKF